MGSPLSTGTRRSAWVARARTLGPQLEALRARHTSGDLVNVFNAYVTTRLVENQANTYGALGIAAALLFSLVLVGRVVVVSAELNGALDDRRTPSRK